MSNTPIPSAEITDADYDRVSRELDDRVAHPPVADTSKDEHKPGKVVIGDGFDNSLSGTDGDDSQSGGDGWDALMSSPGVDYLDGNGPR